MPFTVAAVSLPLRLRVYDSMPHVANVMAINPRKIWAKRLCFWTNSNMEGRAILRCFAVGTTLALAACVHTLALEDHPLVGKAWDARAQTFVSEDQLLARLQRAPRLILGETHDNPQHHRLQRRVLDSL